MPRSSTTYGPGSTGRNANRPVVSVTSLSTMRPKLASRRRTPKCESFLPLESIALPLMLQNADSTVPGSTLGTAARTGDATEAVARGASPACCAEADIVARSTRPQNPGIRRPLMVFPLSLSLTVYRTMHGHRRARLQMTLYDSINLYRNL